MQLHTVKRGETLATIARKLQVSRADLAEANYLQGTARVAVGSKLFIPRMPSAALLARASAGELESTAETIVADVLKETVAARRHGIAAADLSSAARRYAQRHRAQDRHHHRPAEELEQAAHRPTCRSARRLLIQSPRAAQRLNSQRLQAKAESRGLGILFDRLRGLTRSPTCCGCAILATRLDDRIEHSAPVNRDFRASLAKATDCRLNRAGHAIAPCTRMLATIESATVIGVDACRVHVEIDVSRGFPTFQLVGLPDASIRESRDRVRAAMRNCELRVSDLAHHDQPRARRRAQGRTRIRSADRRRHAQAHRDRDAQPISPASSTSASSRSTDRSSRRAACCRSPPKRDATAPARCCCRTTISPKRRSCPACGCCPSARLSEAVERLNQADDEWPAAPAPAPRHPSTSAPCRAIFPIFTARPSRAARSKSPPPAATTC